MLESTGRKADASPDAPLEYPEELTQLFAANPAFAKAFAVLTPGRQRGYLLHFTSAKQSTTRTTRIEKCVPKIFSGKGWNEQ